MDSVTSSLHKATPLHTVPKAEDSICFGTTTSKFHSVLEKSTQLHSHQMPLSLRSKGASHRRDQNPLHLSAMGLLRTESGVIATCPEQSRKVSLYFLEVGTSSSWYFSPKDQIGAIQSALRLWIWWYSFWSNSQQSDLDKSSYIILLQSCESKPLTLRVNCNQSIRSGWGLFRWSDSGTATLALNPKDNGSRPWALDKVLNALLCSKSDSAVTMMLNNT